MTSHRRYNQPSKGTTDWEGPLNENFQWLDEDVELRGRGDPNIALGDGFSGQKYLDRDTGEVWFYDGSNSTWTQEFDLTGGGVDSLTGGDGIAPGTIGDGDTVSVAWSDADALTSTGGITSDAVGTTELATPFPDLATLVGTPVSIGGTLQSSGALRMNSDGANGGSRVLKLGVPTSDGTYIAGGNVLAGHPTNSINGGAVGAVVSGGGNTRTDGNNTVYDNYGTIGGGTGNQAGSDDGDPQDPTNATSATVSGGLKNTASDRQATVGGGWFNTASGKSATVGGGTGNTARGATSTVAGGNSNEADGSNAMVPGGRNNLAQGDYSFAAGRRAKAQAVGSFVWGDSTDANFTSTGADQFLIRASGGVGIGTDSPVSPLHVSSDSDIDDTLSGHTAFIEDTNAYHSRGLAIRTGNDSSGLSTSDQYVTFFDTNNNELGAITGNSNGDGVVYDSFGADYAEYMPRLDPEEAIEPAAIVGVVGDAVTKRTAEADQALVVSEQAVVTGNSPGYQPGDREDHEVCAFIGQVPVRIRGPVEEGDIVVPSGEHDGTGRAITPRAFRAGNGPIVGRAWESDDTDGVSKVTVAVGLETGEAFQATIADQADRIEELDAENDRKDDRMAELEAENEQLREQNVDLEARLAAVEDHIGLGDSGATTQSVADD